MFVSRQLTFFKKITQSGIFFKTPREKAGLPKIEFKIGQDHYGNEYFEVPKGRKPARMTTIGMDPNLTHEEIENQIRKQAQSPNRTPVEWRQWLRKLFRINLLYLIIYIFSIIVFIRRFG
jgi:NADH:ubiquinone oxidoreductase subunit